MKNEQAAELVRGEIGPSLLRMTGPMVLGILSIVLFNLIDSIYIGWLGSHELAAIGFTFAPVFTVNSISFGIGVGASSVISRSIGSGDFSTVKRLATDSLLLALALVGLLALCGYFTIDPLFRAMNADDQVMPLIRDYMQIWYAGIGCVVIPMVGNSVIRSTGDARTPAWIMLIAALTNALLDPLLIFGWGPIPGSGIQGAASATIISYAMAMLAAIYVLAQRKQMLTLQIPALKVFLRSIQSILRIGLPAALTNLMAPLTTFFLTSIIAAHGHEAVAAYNSIGARVESLIFLSVMALSSALGPFIGQNFGARRFDRMRAGLNWSWRFAFLLELGLYTLLWPLAPYIARAINDDPAVIELATLILRIVPAGLSFLSMAVLTSSVCNATGRPLLSSAIIFTRFFVLLLPLAYLGNHFYGLAGLCLGIVAANVLVGLLGLLVGQGLKRVWLRQISEPATRPG